MGTPGWHPDPSQRHDHRWFDGTRWTDQISDRGVAGTDPVGAGPIAAAAREPGPAYPAAGEPPPPVSSRTTLWPVALVGALLVVGLAVAAFVVFGGDDGGHLDAEVEGLRALLDEADPPEDDYELLREDCIVDFEALLTEAGTDVPPAAVDDGAAAYDVAAFDEPFYDCYLGVDPRGFALDAVELDEDATVDDLADVLEEDADDVEILDDEVRGGHIVVACRDLEFPVPAEDGDGAGDDVEEEDVVEDDVVQNDPFCEYAWTYDGAGLAIIVAAHESLDMDGVAALDTIVPRFRQALRDEGG